MMLPLAQARKLLIIRNYQYAMNGRQRCIVSYSHNSNYYYSSKIISLSSEFLFAVLKIIFQDNQHKTWWMDRHFITSSQQLPIDRMLETLYSEGTANSKYRLQQLANNKQPAIGRLRHRKQTALRKSSLKNRLEAIYIWINDKTKRFRHNTPSHCTAKANQLTSIVTMPQRERERVVMQDVTWDLTHLDWRLPRHNAQS